MQDIREAARNKALNDMLQGYEVKPLGVIVKDVDGNDVARFSVGGFAPYSPNKPAERKPKAERKAARRRNRAKGKR